MTEHIAPNGLIYMVEEVPTYAVYAGYSGEYLGTFDCRADAEKAANTDAEDKVDNYPVESTQSIYEAM